MQYLLGLHQMVHYKNNAVENMKMNQWLFILHRQKKGDMYNIRDTTTKRRISDSKIYFNTKREYLNFK